MNKIYIDADACPVKKEVYKVSLRNNIKVVVVSNGGIRPYNHPLITMHVVPQGLDMADNWIAEEVICNDLVITNDIPLAARCIDKGANVIRPDGKKLDASNIGDILASRNLMADIRSADPFFKGKEKVFSNKDRSNFLNMLESECQKLLKQFKN